MKVNTYSSDKLKLSASVPPSVRVRSSPSISETNTVQITVDKPTVIVEFYEGEPDVESFTTTWMEQIEEGLIEIVNR